MTAHVGFVEEASAASLRETGQASIQDTGGGSDSGWLGQALLQSLIQAGTRSAPHVHLLKKHL
jgi:hypothetical protein